MLVLTSRLHEKILLPEARTAIEVVAIQGTSVRLGIEAPEEVRVLRQSIPDRVAEWGPAPTPEDQAPSLPQVEQLLARRLEVARKGLSELQRCLREGRTDDAEDLLFRVDDELHMLRRRVRREVEKVCGRELAVCGG